MGKPGYLMLLAPALLLLAGVGLGRVLRGMPRGQAVGLLLVVVALNVGFVQTAVIAAQQAQDRDYRAIVQACAPYAGPDTVVLTTEGRSRSGALPAELAYRPAMYLLPTCDVFLFPLDPLRPRGGGPNEGRNLESYRRTPPVVASARHLLVAPSLLRYLPADARPAQVISNSQGELWEVGVPTGQVVLGADRVEWGPGAAGAPRRKD